MIVALCAATVRAFGRPDIRLELCCWFVLLSVMAVVLGRAPFTTVEYALSSRYSFPSVLMLATTWMAVAVRFQVRSPIALLVATLLAGGYCATSFQIHSVALQPYVEKRVENFNKGRYWAWTRPMKETNGIVQRSVELGIYAPPPRPMPMPDIARSSRDGTREAGFL